jgi:hypothetical protein
MECPLSQLSRERCTFTSFKYSNIVLFKVYSFVVINYLPEFPFTSRRVISFYILVYLRDFKYYLYVSLAKSLLCQLGIPVQRYAFTCGAVVNLS